VVPLPFSRKLRYVHGMRFAPVGAYALTAAVLVAQTGSSPADPADLYQRARRRVLDDLVRLPNFTCVQTITRRSYASAQKKGRPPCDEIIRDRNAEKRNQSLSWDRLRVDVAIADKQEVYSWAGAARFEQNDLQQLVGGGLTGTGDFGPLLLGIFDQHAAMSYQGARQVAGRRLFEYGYQTPEKSSQFSVKLGWLEFTTAYKGSVFLDPATSDVVRVIARSAVLPEQSGYCQVARELDFARLRVGATDTLIPREASSYAIDRSGTEVDYASSYAGCREYRGESVLRFDDPEIDQPSTASGNLPALGPLSSIPPGRPFECRITTLIDSGSAAAGDRIEATLRTPITDASGKVLASPCARIHGRLMNFAEHQRSGDQRQRYEIGVQLRSIELAGGQVPFAATLVTATDKKGALIRFTPHPPGAPTFVFYEKELHLTSLDSKWITAAPDQTSSPAR
jgi:hypothetical protein